MQNSAIIVATCVVHQVSRRVGIQQTSHTYLIIQSTERAELIFFEIIHYIIDNTGTTIFYRGVRAVGGFCCVALKLPHLFRCPVVF